jgi:hypothetical protein
MAYLVIYYSTANVPDIRVEWLASLPVLIFSPEASCLDQGYVFSLSFQENVGIVS